MSELFKNIYNRKFFDFLLEEILEIKPGFDRRGFGESVFDEEWEGRELKERMRHISISLKNHLPDDYGKNLKFILNCK